MRRKPRIPAARLFTAAAKHEASYYRPLRVGGQTIARRINAIGRGQPQGRKPARPPEPLEISRQAGWYYMCTTAGIVGLAVAGIAQGNTWCVSLLPIALIPGILALGGLRRSKR